MTGVTGIIWIGGIKLMGAIGLDAWRRVGERSQALVTLLIMVIPVIVAPLLAQVLVNAVYEVSFSVVRAAFAFGVSLLVLWGVVSGLLLIGLGEGLVAKAAVIGVFAAALLSTLAADTSEPFARIGAPQNNKMQQTSHG
jgi:hypothetical protein